MSSEQFRRQLRDESQDWQQEGLIDAQLYQRLAERYSFGTIEDASSNRFIGILLGIGGILLGLGAITFVAANWQDWSRVARMILLVTIFIGVNTTGFYLWQYPQKNARLNRLGHGLLLTGALVLGANLGLMSQMFHQGGPIYQLLGVWSLGVLAMAYGLRLVSLGVFSWILMMQGYWNFLFEGIGGSTDVAFLPQFMLYLPLGATLLYLPLAHWLKSRALFGLWGVSFAFLFTASQFHWLSGGIGSAWAIAASLPVSVALLWVYQSTFWNPQFLSPQVKPVSKQKRDPFQSIGQALSIWLLSISFYLFSFRFWWTDNPMHNNPSDAMDIPWIAPLSLIIYVAMAIYGGWRWVRCDRDRLQPRAQWMKTPVIASLLLVTYGLGVTFLNGARITIIGPALINLMAFILSVILLHDGLRLGNRRRFWGGMSLLVISLISRMFEYNTDLIIKAIALTGCGLGIIAAGLWFEYQAKLSIQKKSLAENAS